MKRLAASATLLVLVAARAAAQCPDGTPPPCGRPAGANSVGVMSFNNLTRDSTYQYLSDGLATEIATSLARVPRLEVRSPGAVRAAQRGIAAAPDVVGRRLNVRYVVEGDFQRGGDRIRVSVRLVAVQSGTQRWSNAYTRPVADLLSVQEEIAGAVATAIAGELLPQDRSQLAVRPTRSGQAYDHYLRGNFHLARRDSAGYVRALAEFDAAFRADTTFADALARTASAQLIAAGALGLSREVHAARATAAADAALRLDPNSAIVWLAVAQTRQLREPRTLAGVQEAYDRALALDSSNADVLHGAGVVASYRGDHARATALYHRALAVDPLRAVTLNNLVSLALRDGRYAEAVRWADSIPKVDADYFAPRWRPMRLGALLRVDTTEARAEVERWRSIPTMARIGEVLGPAAFAAPGDPALFERLATEYAAARQRDGMNSLIAAMLADILMWRGAPASAVLTVLESVPSRDAQFRSTLRVRSLDAIRNEPRFQRLWAESSP